MTGDRLTRSPVVNALKIHVSPRKFSSSERPQFPATAGRFYLDVALLPSRVCAPPVDCATTASLFGVKLTQKPVVIRHHGRAVMVRSHSVLRRGLRRVVRRRKHIRFGHGLRRVEGLPGKASE